MTATELRLPVDSERTEVLLDVQGMTCGACAARIERRLNRMEGVEARVNFASERAAVSLGATADLPSVVAEVRALGYGADPVEDGLAGREVADDDRVRSLRRRLMVAAALFMPLCDVSLAFWLLPELRFPGWQVPVLALAAPVVGWAALPFYRAAWAAARHRSATMDTLVTIGILASTAWSVYAMVWVHAARSGRSLLWVLAHGTAGGIYLDVGAGVTAFLLCGRYFEARARQESGSALRSLASLAARDVAVVGADGSERRVPVGLLGVGDRFVVRPGESVAADGVIEEGLAALDRSAMTGESVPAEVGPGDEVTGGTVPLDGRLVVRASRVGADTQLARMVALVEAAQNEKAAAQRLADRVSAVFVPVVLVVAAGTLTGWLLAGQPVGRALDVTLSVLIIACPCALGLATPAALVVASGEGARRGIFFKGHQALERTRQVDTVVLDKTGTLTEGRMRVVGVASAEGVDPDGVLAWAASLEHQSSHPIGLAVLAAAAEAGAWSEGTGATDVRSTPGLGLAGVVDGHPVTVGRATLVGASPEPALASAMARWGASGATTVVVGRDGAVLGAIAVADTIRPSAPAAMARLRDLGLRCLLVSGDAAPAVAAVAGTLGIVETVADALPATKVEVVRRLQAEGHVVAVVGDGINDGPALAAADLGLAVGSGTDVALNAADLLVLRDDLAVVADGVELARRTLRVIRGNLVWAFGYNVVAIPLAAAGVLNPLIAGAAMSLSSAFVVANSFRIRRGRPTRAEVAARLEEAASISDLDLLGSASSQGRAPRARAT